ncbi:DMT family transporter [Marinobacterium rhizophilum]|uniref:DMT family transporter n=1 Tax=Marinobacterium rhizophilum TaxID=420402 RepID=A0ABY5HHY4_9GAMM|nr:DMT family transporter [Marinobacterium rhizophilum]UTW11579.1 DMT family transporter [Marinobacterium rhizophilum]
MSTKSQGRALVLGLGAVLLWSTVATAFKLALAHLTPLQLLAVASIVSTLVLVVAISLQRRWGELARAWQHNRWRYLGLGFLNPFFYYLVLFKAYDLLPAQQAQPLNYTWALTLSLLAVPLLGQRLHGRDFVAMLLGYVGVLVIATRGDILALQFDSPLGVALALGSTVLWALYWIYNARSEDAPVVGLLLCFLCGLPWVLATAWISDGLPASWSGVGAAVYVGLFEMGITFMLWLSALKTATHASRIGNLIFLSPFLSLIFIAQVLGESIHPSVYPGLMLIVGGVILQQWRRR